MALQSHFMEPGHCILSNGGEIGEPSVILSSYLRDIYICMFVLLATLPLRGRFAAWGICPAEPSATYFQLSLTHFMGPKASQPAAIQLLYLVVALAFLPILVTLIEILQFPGL